MSERDTGVGGVEESVTDAAVDERVVDDPADVEYPEVPDWDDEYLDRVSDRIMFNYDLEKDYRVRGERFDLYGKLLLESQKQLWHPSLNYANHETREHLFAHRVDRVSVAELERLVSLAHDLADEWIERTEEHFGTDFTFVVVADELPEDVREFVAGFEDRTLLRFGYYGHYRVNLAVVAPEGVGIESGDAVASAEAAVVDAFTIWREIPLDRGTPGVFQRFVRRLWE